MYFYKLTGSKREGVEDFLYLCFALYPKPGSNTEKEQLRTSITLFLFSTFLGFFPNPVEKGPALVAVVKANKLFSTSPVRENSGMHFFPHTHNLLIIFLKYKIRMEVTSSYNISTRFQTLSIFTMDYVIYKINNKTCTRGILKASAGFLDGLIGHLGHYETITKCYGLLKYVYYSTPALCNLIRVRNILIAMGLYLSNLEECYFLCI